MSRPFKKPLKHTESRLPGGEDWDDGKTADERQLDANTVGSKQVADDEAWLENQYLASQPHIEIDGVNYPINPGVSLADGAQTTEGEITGANYMANLSGTKSVTIRDSNTAGPDYLVTADDGSQFYVEEKTLIGDSKNTLSNNIKAAIGNFESKGASSEAAAQASAGQAKVVINATGTVNWNNPDNVRAYRGENKISARSYV